MVVAVIGSPASHVCRLGGRRTCHDAGRIVGVEVLPELGDVEEIGVEADDADDDQAEHRLQDPAALHVPAAGPHERPQDDADDEADAAADPLENAGEEIHDRIEHSGVPSVSCFSMILSENRFPLFGIML